MRCKPDILPVTKPTGSPVSLWSAILIYTWSSMETHQNCRYDEARDETWKGNKQQKRCSSVGPDSVWPLLCVQSIPPSTRLLHWSDVSRLRSGPHTMEHVTGWLNARLNSRTHSSTNIGYECRKGLCSRSKCRLTRHCTVMPLSTFGSLHQSSASRPDKDFGLPPRTICVFLLSDCLLLDVVLSLSLALVFGTILLPMSLQHLLCPLSENV